MTKCASFSFAPSLHSFMNNESQPLLPRLPQKQSLVTQTALIIKQQIRSGSWTQRLPSERTLSEMLKVSRVTLRAALTQLRRERVLQAHRGQLLKLAGGKRTAALTSARNNVVLLTPQPLHMLPPFVMYWIDHLRAHLGAAGCRLETVTQKACYGPRARYALEELTRTARPAAWVLHRSTAPMQHWMSDNG